MGYAPQNVRGIIPAMLPQVGIPRPGSISSAKDWTQLLIGTSSL